MSLIQQLVSFLLETRITPHLESQVKELPMSSLYAVMMKPIAPLLGVIFYLTLVKKWELRNAQRAAKMAAEKPSGKPAGSNSNGLQKLIITHNLVLAVYSLWTFIDFSPAVLRNIQQAGFKNGFCDVEWTLRGDKLLMHGFLFYLSKYYEFIDTMIILAKGRRATSLQTFHHSGAVVIMWMGNFVHSPYLAFFVFENSIIHTLMYIYYSLTAMGYKPPGKQMLTRLQISQFYIALSAGAVYSVLPGCQSNEQKLFTYVFIGYIIMLIALFTQFARKTYGQKAAAALATAATKSTKVAPEKRLQ
ncbi:hypothetical protein LPJ66_008355 [Kickxella alabastrina]|uniref:Uncharacterized protein n=1 Tax=Kickxella alabastrina TaxID=61397 RepID=A0ACC1I6W2_9FUNG|nr:hypothetical protein LPJ66_008355 [Kickxella alabastrina]